MLRAFAPCGFLVVVGCAPTPAQTPSTTPAFAEGMRRLCDVDRLAGLDPDLDPVSTEGERYERALAHVEDPDVIELVTLMRVRSDAERVQMLRENAGRANIQSCSLADTLAAIE